MSDSVKAETEDYEKAVAGPPPEPPAQVRLIRSEIIHSMPAVEIFGLTASRLIRSELISSMPVKDLISWVGQPTPANLLPDSITVGVSHAF